MISTIISQEMGYPEVHKYFKQQYLSPFWLHPFIGGILRGNQYVILL